MRRNEAITVSEIQDHAEHFGLSPLIPLSARFLAVAEHQLSMEKGEISAALGRPMTFHDEDIDQELPLCVDDDQLHPGYGTRLTEGGSSLASAPVAQIKLSRIVARVLRSLYGIKSCSTEEHLAFATRFNKDFSEWRDSISYLLDTAGPSALYVKHEEVRMNIQLCVDAAIEITKHINLINNASELYSTLFRYGVVLQELRLEVLRNNTYLASVSTPRAGDWSTTKEINENQTAFRQKPQSNPRISDSESRLVMGRAAESVLQDAGAPFHAFDVGFLDMTNWAQFDSLASNIST
ncbi:finger protein [Colletotrichum salicis]|uniref:Finger protein n=1 Tax=Colletotrichum salicis TaxID=1209931 RepID=A0A135UH01_9PEZI|nr:finger protein [Colletotrichum salicis]